MMMVRWMCKVSLKDKKTFRELRERCGLESIGDSLQKRRLSWFGHVERMDDNNWVKRSSQFVVVGNHGRGPTTNDMGSGCLHGSCPEGYSAWFGTG